MSGAVSVRRPLALASSLLALAISSQLHAQVAPTASDWGGIGLLQTPTARMADDGELSFVASHTSPYSRYNVTLQPFPWLEGTFRYINVSGVPYGPESLSGNQNYKDKSIDFKLRLLRESRWIPEVAFGARDVGGTGLFASEYLVASKRFGQFDASLGLATGYLGSNGDFANPLGAVDDRFKERPGIQGPGDFNTNSMFRGRVGVFGGVAWQTPWDPLQVKLEYDGHDYDAEPRPWTTGDSLEQKSRFNLGLHYSVSPGVKVSVGWERGTELMAALTLRGNLATARSLPRFLDPKPVELEPQAGAVTQPSRVAMATRDVPATDPHTIDWNAVAADLQANAGIVVEDIAVSDHEVVVSGEQSRYFHPSEGLGRAARILHNATPPEIEWFTLEQTRVGMPIVESSVSRQALVDFVGQKIDVDTLARSVELNPPGSSRQGEVVLEQPFKRFSSGFAPGFRQLIGGPDGFLLYQVTANWSANFAFSRNTWISGTLAADVVNNFDKFRYDAPSNLPRVRTDVRQYVTTSELMVPALQLTHTRQLSRDVYGMAYAGLFESMYGGVGGEVVYRPFGERWALGAELNWVQQRDYDQHFGFRDYRIVTGHVSGQYLFGEQQRTQVGVSVGRYLAGDVGATLNVSRVFRNGVSMGAWATKTDVSAEEFGEGSFDKGIYFSVPLNFLMPRSTRSRVNTVWNPLLRDGGARVGHMYSLFNLTSERDGEFFFDTMDEFSP